MWQLFRPIMFAFLLTYLAGCTHSPVKNISNLANKDLDQITAEMAANALEGSNQYIDGFGATISEGFILNKKVNSVSDETQNLRHWMYSFDFLTYDMSKDETSLMTVYENYCSEKNGKLSGKVRNEKTCRKSSDNTALFHAYIHEVDQGPALITKRIKLMRIYADVFERKNASQADDVSTDYIRNGDAYISKAVKLAQDQEVSKREEDAHQKEYQLLVTSNSLNELNRLISKFQKNDPNSLIPQAKIRVAEISAKDEARRAKEEEIRAKEQTIRAKEEAAQQEKERQKIASFRKSLSEGNESNCGSILEIKGNLVKIVFAVANYGNEHWIRRSEIFPSGYGCRFLNGQYQPPQ